MPDTETIQTPVEKTEAQLAAEKKLAEIEAQKAKAKAVKAAKAALKEKQDFLRANIGKVFTDGSKDATVTGFEPSKELGGVYSECFLVNFGNHFRSDYVPCEPFLSQFKIKA